MTNDALKDGIRFDRLEFKDQLVLWASRMWILHASDGKPMPPAVKQTFEVAGISEAVHILHEFLTIVGAGAVKTLYFQPIECGRVSDDETLLLTILQASRTHQSEDYAWRLLLGWLPPAQAIAALGPAVLLARMMAIKLPSPRSSHLKRTVQLNETRWVPSDPGINLLH